jgi:hypothetical protein
MRASTIVALSTFSLALCSTMASSARADETATPSAKKGTIEIGVKITGRRPPRMTVDVARLVQKAPLPELRQPLLDRIGAAAEKDPF